MTRTLSTTYRVETKWPHNGRDGWRYVPEDDDLTMGRAKQVLAKQVLAKRKPFEGEGMQQRLIAVSTRVVLVSKSRRLNKSALAYVRNLREMNR